MDIFGKDRAKNRTRFPGSSISSLKISIDGEGSGRKNMACKKFLLAVGHYPEMSEEKPEEVFDLAKRFYEDFFG